MQPTRHVTVKFFFAALLLLITGTTFCQTWSSTGSITTARSAHAATLLPNGNVLIAGGYDGSNYLNSCELYDPASGTWSGTGSMTFSRENFTATVLQNGMVLVAGGFDGNNYLNNCELYDPVSGTWSNTGSMGTARTFHTATLLPDGKVLVTGGKAGGGNNYLNSAELYDPVSGTWSGTGSMAITRTLHTATLLQNGKVLVAGGYNGSYFNTCELYDPVSGVWSGTGAMITSRDAHTATILNGGKVLVAGGYNGSYLNSCELYDAVSGTWSNTGSLLSAREFHTAILLQKGGQILATGGYNGSYLSSSELYDAASGAWYNTGSMAFARNTYTATILSTGQVLVTGGYNGNYLSSSELSAHLVFKNVITANSSANGSILPEGLTNVHDGGNQEYAILPDMGYHTADVQIDGVSDDDAIINGSYTFINVVTDHTIQVSFVADTYTITTTAGENGSIDETFMANYGSDAVVNITPNTGYHVADILVDGSSVGAAGTYTFTNVTTDHSISVIFAINTYTIVASADANGSISPNNSTTISYGGSQAYTITANTGFHILDVLADGSSVGAVTTYTFSNVTADHTISATFADNNTSYAINASTGANGSISPSGTTNVSTGGSQTYTITPAAGFSIATLVVDGSSVSPATSYTFTDVRATHTIRATFSISKYTITSDAGLHGTISPKGNFKVNYNGGQTYTITPDAGYRVADVLVDGSSAGAVTSYTFTNVMANHTIHATFARGTFTITSSAGSNGTISPVGTTTVNYGTSQTYIILANSGYKVSKVLIDGSAAGKLTSYTFTDVTANHRISASFICTKPAAPVLSGPASVTKKQNNLIYTVTNAEAGNTYTWTVPAKAQIISGQGTPVITVKWSNISGDVGCTAGNDCGKSARTLYAVAVGAVFANTGSAGNNVTSMPGLTTLKVNPNPVQDKAKLIFNISQAGKCSVQLFDLTGKILTVKEVNANKGLNETTLDLSRFAAGNYFISLSNTKEIKTVMLIKAG